MLLANVHEYNALRLLIEVVGAENLVIIPKDGLNGDLFYCKNTWKNHPEKDKKYLLFIEGGVGTDWLTPMGKEHRIELLLIAPNGTCTYIDTKYRKNEKYLFNLADELSKAFNVRHNIIFAISGDVVNSTAFNRFRRFIPLYNNIFVIDVDKELKRLLKRLLT